MFTVPDGITQRVDPRAFVEAMRALAAADPLRKHHGNSLWNLGLPFCLNGPPEFGTIVAAALHAAGVPVEAIRQLDAEANPTAIRALPRFGLPLGVIHWAADIQHHEMDRVPRARAVELAQRRYERYRALGYPEVFLDSPTSTDVLPVPDEAVLVGVFGHDCRLATYRIVPNGEGHALSEQFDDSRSMLLVRDGSLLGIGGRVFQVRDDQPDAARLAAIVALDTTETIYPGDTVRVAGKRGRWVVGRIEPGLDEVRVAKYEPEQITGLDVAPARLTLLERGNTLEQGRDRPPTADGLTYLHSDYVHRGEIHAAGALPPGADRVNNTDEHLVRHSRYEGVAYANRVNRVWVDGEDRVHAELANHPVDTPDRLSLYEFARARCQLVGGLRWRMVVDGRIDQSDLAANAAAQLNAAVAAAGITWCECSICRRRRGE